MAGLQTFQTSGAHPPPNDTATEQLSRKIGFVNHFLQILAAPPDANIPLPQLTQSDII